MSVQMNYELKQYKKGLKAADTVLKKFPNHGGTSTSPVSFPVDVAGLFYTPRGYTKRA